MEVSCPWCGKRITIPPKPVWLPAINEMLQKLIGTLVVGKMDFARARWKLAEVISSAGYNPETALVERDGPEDLLCPDRLDLVIGTNSDIANGYSHFVQGNDPDVVVAFPAWSFFRLEDRKHPRDWSVRWRRAFEHVSENRRSGINNEHYIARKDSPIWSLLGDRSLFADAIGNPYPPFAVNSGMYLQGLSYEEALAVGLIRSGEFVNAHAVPAPPALMPIEDERFTEYLWNQPAKCVHCGEQKAAKLLNVCDECGEYICHECRPNGCDVQEAVDNLSDALQCCNQAVVEVAGLSLPLPQHVAERIVQLCGRAIEFGFADDQRYYEARTHWMLGEAFHSLGRREQALREYELAMEKVPTVEVKRRIASLQKECGK